MPDAGVHVHPAPASCRKVAQEDWNATIMPNGLPKISPE
jgi:hypothetical protein